ARVESPPPATAAPPPPETADAVQPTSTSPWRLIGMGTAGVGLVAMGAGVFLGVDANGAKNDSRCREGRVCPDEASAARLRDAKSEADIGAIVFVAGSALAIAGVTIFFL